MTRRAFDSRGRAIHPKEKPIRVLDRFLAAQSVEETNTANENVKDSRISSFALALTRFSLTDDFSRQRTCRDADRKSRHPSRDQSRLMVSARRSLPRPLATLEVEERENPIKHYDASIERRSRARSSRSGPETTSTDPRSILSTSKLPGNSSHARTSLFLSFSLENSERFAERYTNAKRHTRNANALS